MRVHLINKDEIKGYSVDVGTIALFLIPLMILTAICTALFMPLFWAFLIYLKKNKPVQQLVMGLMAVPCIIMWISWFI